MNPRRGHATTHRVRTSLARSLSHRARSAGAGSGRAAQPLYQCLQRFVIGTQGKKARAGTLQGAVHRVALGVKCLGIPGAESGVVGIDPDLLAGFRILHNAQSLRRQFPLAGVFQVHCNQIVPTGKNREMGLPVGGLLPVAEEVGKHKHQAASPQRGTELDKEPSQVAWLGWVRCAMHPQLLDDSKLLRASSTRGEVHWRNFTSVVDPETDAVAAVRNARHDKFAKVDQLGALAPAAASSVLRGAQIRHNPRTEVAILAQQAHLQFTGTGTCMPINAPDIVARLVELQVDQIKAAPPGEAEEVALDKPGHAPYKAPT